MATKDLTNLKVTITNNSNEEVAFRYYRVNFVEKLAAGDVVILVAGSGEEAAYYEALNDANIGLSVVLSAAE